MKDCLILLKKVLYKWFIVGFLLLILSGVLFIFFKDWGAEIAQKWYGIEPTYYFNLMVTLLAALKLFLFFCILSPAIAIHWVIGCCKCKKKEEE